MSMPATDSVPAATSTTTAGRPEIVLKSSEFRKGRAEGWLELERLVNRVERQGIRRLSLDELQRLPILYRAALSSLSVARTIVLDRNLLLYLETLSIRAFLAVYGPRANPITGLRTFFAQELPAAVRSARSERNRNATPSGNAVAASPKLWIRSASSATDPDRAKISVWTTAAAPSTASETSTARSPARERLTDASTRPCRWGCPA